MFKKFGKNLEHTEELPHRDLADRPVHPFGADMMNSFHVKDSVEEEPETVIGSQVEITGTLTFQKLLRIDGSFEGELISSGKLIIGPTGFVKADIDLEEAFISGKVEGNVTVKKRLVLRGRAEVRGDISAPLISVDEGVKIIGRLSVETDTALQP
jgi:cytoskeletal protein CcmA (bactofilin family)